MTLLIDPLESRLLMAAHPTRYDVTLARHRMTITATGTSASIGLYEASAPGDETGPVVLTGAELLVQSTELYVNGQRQPTNRLSLPFIGQLKSIAYRGTAGIDNVSLDNEGTFFRGVFDVALGAGDDEAEVYAGSGGSAAIAVVGGAGNDRIHVSGNTTTDINLQPGGGRDKVYLTTAARKFLLHDEDAATYLNIQDTVFSGGVNITLGPADDFITLYHNTFTHNTVIHTSGANGTAHDTLTESGNVLPFATVIDLGDDGVTMTA